MTLGELRLIHRPALAAGEQGRREQRLLPRVDLAGMNPKGA